MALLDIFKMKKLGGTVLLKDNSFLYISKVTGTQFEEKGKDMRILYEDGNGIKKEFMISQVKEAHPVEEQPPLEAPFSDGKQSVFTLLNNMNKLKDCEGFFIMNDGNRIDVYRVLEFNDMKVTWIGIYDDHKRTADFRHIKEAHVSNGKSCALLKELHKNSEIGDNDPYKLTRQFGLNKINLDYVSPETLDKNYDYQPQGLSLDYQPQGGETQTLSEETSQEQPNLTNSLDINDPSSFNNEPGSFKKRKLTEVPLMDDDLENILNRTREESYKLIERMIDEGVEKFEFSSQTVPTDVYQILIMTKGKKKSFAVLQNDNEDVFILDMNSLFIVNAIKDGSRSVQPAVQKPSVEEPSVKVNYPGGPWFLNKRRKLDLPSIQDIIRGDDCKSIIVPGEPALYNAYLKRDLKETMIENLIKKELSNDLNILLSETDGKEVLIYVGDDISLDFSKRTHLETHTQNTNKPHTLIKIVKDPNSLTEYYEEIYGSKKDVKNPLVFNNAKFSCTEPIYYSTPDIKHKSYTSGNDTINIKCNPLPAHLKCLAPTRYTEDELEFSSEETYFTPIKKREIKVPDAPRKQTQQTFEDPTNLNVNDMVTFLYKGEEKRILVKESNDKYLEGICQEQNKYKKYLVRYIEKVVSYREPPVYSSSDDDTDTIDSPEYMPYKRMVLNAIKDMYVNGTRGSSRQAIQAYLLANYNHHINESRFQDNLRRTLRRLVETGCIVQNKQKFKLGDEGRMYLKKFTLKELKPDTRRISSKKGNPTPKTGNPVQPNNSRNSKHDKIQFAIDNEKILDIMYDGGSIPDIKRPVRPLKVFKTVYSKKEILQGICLIDDNIKNFTLDKVTIIE